MDGTGQLIQAFAVATALGAIVGLERQVASEGDPETDSLAGVRTFALYALWGAGAGWLGDHYGAAGFVVAAAAFGGLLVANYVGVSLRTADWGTTTEAAKLAVFLVGVLVYAEEIVVGLAVAVGTAALLRAKDWLHAKTERFSDEDLRAALQFAVITAIVLPLIPDEDFGPFDAINFRKIWLMVVFVSAIGLVGYAALRLLGRRGLPLTGLFGGLVSSTAVTLGFSKMSRKSDAAMTDALAAGIIAASGLMYARVWVEAAVIDFDLAEELLVPLGLLFLVVEGGAVWWWLRSRSYRDSGEAGFEVSNPLTLSSALQFGALFGVVLFASKALLDRVSEASLNVVGAVSGINDVDAITLSTADLVRNAGLDPAVGARVVLAAVTVNTLVKGAMAVVLGSRQLGVRVGTILGVGAIGGAVAWVLA